jgi:drug/metabolite transporter (DMT)-like permease
LSPSSCRARTTSSWISTRRGDLSLIAPFRYTAILFATVAGFVIWGDTPNALAWCGIALVIASGVYVLRVSRRARTRTGHGRTKSAN